MVGVEVVAVADRPQGGVVVGEHLGGDLSAAEFAHVQSVAGERRSRPARHERLAHPLRDRLLAQQHLRGVKGQGSMVEGSVCRGERVETRRRTRRDVKVRCQGQLPQSYVKVMVICQGRRVKVMCQGHMSRSAATITCQGQLPRLHVKVSCHGRMSRSYVKVSFHGHMPRSHVKVRRLGQVSASDGKDHNMILCQGQASSSCVSFRCQG